MKFKYLSKAKGSGLPTTKESTETLPTSSSAAGIPSISMFNNAQNTHIIGGLFNLMTNFNTVHGPPWDVLYGRVAPNAILNAGGRADEVRCHPGTRKEVIRRIEEWGDTEDSRTAPIFWLSGPAGAGKSAIVQTIAERCKQRRVPHANFFFYRADTSRSNASPLIATLLHQIILLYPVLRDPVAAVLSANPLIFDSVLEDQLTQLIVTPLRAIQQSLSAYRPLMLLVDGLDECDSESKRSQQQILHVFDTVLAEQPCPFRLLVASRDESQIRAAFNRISSQCLHLYLDSQYSPERDIQFFVQAQFEQVRKTHPLAYTLDARWPSVKDISFIVDKSSGQFIYAATVMRFISDSAATPMLSLERVQGAAQLAAKSPFSHLDNIYSYILSQADDQEVLKDILHAQLLIVKVTQVQLHQVTFIEILEYYNTKYTKAVILSCLADLTSIVRYNAHSRELQFYHASFSDYLFDRSRSGDFFVDIAAFSYKILPPVWKRIKDEPREERWVRFGISGISCLQKLPPGLMNTLASSNNVWTTFLLSQRSIFEIISGLCINDDEFPNFRHILRQWIDNFDIDHVSFDKIKHIPFSRRYIQMVRADHFHAPDDEMAAALRPETDFDRQELALWLNSLLHRIHKEIYHCNVQRYRQLLTAWIFWAIENDIPCDGLDDLPDATDYIWISRTDIERAHNLSVIGSGT